MTDIQKQLLTPQVVNCMYMLRSALANAIQECKEFPMDVDQITISFKPTPKEGISVSWYIDENQQPDIPGDIVLVEKGGAAC